MEPLLTVAEVATILKVSQKTVRRERARGNLRARQVGRQYRFNAEDVNRYIDQAEVLPPVKPLPGASRPRQLSASSWEKWVRQLVLTPGQNKYVSFALIHTLRAIANSEETKLGRRLLALMAQGEYGDKAPEVARIVNLLLWCERIRSIS